MRALPLVVLGLAGIALVRTASADRLINAPTATKLRVGSYRYEHRFSLGGSATDELVMVPLDRFFEVEYRARRRVGERADTVDLYYTAISPFNGIAPGIAFGVRDTLGATREGRRFWGAVTIRRPVTVGDTDLNMDATYGLIGGRHFSPYGGVSMPLSRATRLLAEYDGIRFAAGVQVAPIRNLELRATAESSAILGSVRYTLRF